MNNLDC